MNSEVVFSVESHYADAEKYKNIKNFSTGDLIDELIRRFGREGITIHIGKTPNE